MSKRKGYATKYFHALGERDKRIYGRMRNDYRKQHVGCWPDFAKNAYIRGWHGMKA